MLTPVSRRRFNAQGEFYDTHGEYPELIRAVAAETKTPLIDLQRKSEAVLRQFGPEDSKRLFLQLKPDENPNYPKGIEDNTHSNPQGAELLARLAADGVAEAKLPLARYLRNPLPVPVAQQPKPLSAQMAETAMQRVWLDPTTGKAGIPPKWVYDFGVILNGMKGLWFATGDKTYFDNIKRGVDAFVNEDGTIRTYTVEEYNIDQVHMARAVLLVYRVTGEAKYKKAADLVRSQLKTHPRTNEGGLWHKKIYPFQMWLDGLYMGQPFLAEYAQVFHETETFDDIANQFIWMESHVRDEKTGLLYHAWDESKKMPWADKTTGRAPMFWGRAIGWYAMAIVDVLDYFPAGHPKRQQLIAILNRTMTALAKVQDKNSGVWWLILDKPNEKGNYLEASASCMFTYALAKGARMGYLSPSFMKVADNAYAGIQKEFLQTANGQLTLLKTIGGAGLGGNPYRDGSYNYYIGEKIVSNDPKGVGAFIKAAVEMELAPTARAGTGQTVLLDDYFNHETKPDDNGQTIAWHYKWDELANGGYSLWGQIFRSYGAKTETLSSAPTAANLKPASVYIIVDPDTEKETPKPNFIQAEHIKAISEWVKAGGVLALLGNDTGNCEFENFNKLAAAFGVEFQQNSLNRVQGNNFAQGMVMVPAQHPVFPVARQLYLKEISTLNVKPPATPLLQHQGNVIAATAKYGKGAVFALGDPWLYNEYTDGRKLPADYDNFKAAKELSAWLLQQARR